MSDGLITSDHSGVLRAFASPAGIADNLIIAGVPGRKIKVLAIIMFTGGGLNTVTLKSAANGIAPAKPLPANFLFVLPFCEAGWMLTAIGEPLNLALTAATAVQIHVIYATV